MKALDLAGQRFGWLTALRVNGRMNHRLAWECICDCGVRKTIRSSHLVHGLTRSCGCKKAELLSAANGTHRRSKDRVYFVYQTMVSRCNNPDSHRYADYGGRGIRVCARWIGDGGFERFILDMGEPPSERHSIDRVDNNKGYSKQNCRWATAKEQARNRRISLVVTFNGQTKTLGEWVEVLGLRYKTVHKRIHKFGWSVERALTTPIPAAGRSEP